MARLVSEDHGGQTLFVNCFASRAAGFGDGSLFCLDSDRILHGVVLSKQMPTGERPGCRGLSILHNNMGCPKEDLVCD